MRNRTTSLAVATAITASLSFSGPQVFPVRFNPETGRNERFGRTLRWNEVGHGRTKPRQSTAQNKRAAVKAKNVKRHRAACRG